MQDDHSFERNEQVIIQLWPKNDWANDNTEMRKLFKKKFSLLNQMWLYEALQEAKATSPSWHPEINHIMKIYTRIESAKLTRNFGPVEAANKWWVDYERPSKHTGLMYKFSTDAPTEKAAHEIAASCNGRVRNYSQPDDRISMVRFLLSQSRETIASAVTALRTARMMSNDKLPADISQWRQATIGYVTHQIQTSQKAITT